MVVQFSPKPHIRYILIHNIPGPLQLPSQLRIFNFGGGRGYPSLRQGISSHERGGDIQFAQLLQLFPKILDTKTLALAKIFCDQIHLYVCILPRNFQSGLFCTLFLSLTTTLLPYWWIVQHCKVQDAWMYSTLHYFQSIGPLGRCFL